MTELQMSFRAARRGDGALLLHLIRKLAEYEQLLDEVSATDVELDEWLFDKRAAEVLFVLADGREVGYALYFTSFSTFLGRPGLYLEDIFVLPKYRGQGLGKALFTELARLAVQRGYGRFEWSCLDWNTPSIEFYRSLGAQPMKEWTVFRLTGGALSELGGSSAS